MTSIKSATPNTETTSGEIMTMIVGFELTDKQTIAQYTNSSAFNAARKGDEK